MPGSYRNAPAGPPNPSLRPGPRKPAKKGGSAAPWLLLAAAGTFAAALLFAACAYLFFSNLSYNRSINHLQQRDYAAAVKDLSVVPPFYRDARRYRALAQAGQAMQENRLDEALRLLGALEGFGGAESLIEETRYRQGLNLLEAGDYADARGLFAGLGEYADSKAMMTEADYRQAKAWLEAGDLSRARELFVSLGGYRDSADMAMEADYRLASALLQRREYERALGLFGSLAENKYRDADEKRKETLYGWAMALYAQGDLRGAFDLLQKAGGYRDSASMLSVIAGKFFQQGVALYRKKDYAAAKETLLRAGSLAAGAADYLALIDAHAKTAGDARGDYAGMKALFSRLTAMGALEDARALRVSDAFIFFRLEGEWAGDNVSMTVAYNDSVRQWYMGSLEIDGDLYTLKAQNLYVKYNGEWALAAKIAFRSEDGLRIVIYDQGKVFGIYNLTKA